MRISLIGHPGQLYLLTNNYKIIIYNLDYSNPKIIGQSIKQFLKLKLGNDWPIKGLGNQSDNF